MAGGMDCTGEALDIDCAEDDCCDFLLALRKQGPAILSADVPQVDVLGPRASVSPQLEALDLSALKPGLENILPTMNRSKLYIRASYLRLLKLVELSLRGGDHHLVITGSPGIGKSVWILLYLATTDRDPIILQQSKRFIVFSRKEDYVRFLDHDMWTIMYIEGLDPAKAVLIADSVQPVLTQIPTLLVTSPCRSIINKWAKKMCVSKWFYLQPWRLEELLAAVHLDKPNFPTDEVVKRMFDIWGGKARMCLDPKADPCKMDDITTALNRKSIKHTANSMDEEELDCKGAHVLVAYTVDPDTLQCKGLEWASDKMRRMASENLMELTWSDIHKMLHIASCHKGPGKSPAVGLLEPWVLRDLGRIDHKPNLRNLTAIKCSQTKPEVAVKAEFSFKTLDEITENHQGCLYVPQYGDQEAIDAFLPPSTAFQITIADRHPVKLAGLYLAAKKMGCIEGGIDLVFLVPEKLYKQYKLQELPNNVPQSEQEKQEAILHSSPWRRAAASIPLSDAENFKEKVRQWVLPMNFNPHGTAEAQIHKLKSELKKIQHEQLRKRKNPESTP